MRIEQFASLHEGPLLLLKATPTRVLILAIAYEPLFFYYSFYLFFLFSFFVIFVYVFICAYSPVISLFIHVYKCTHIIATSVPISSENHLLFSLHPCRYFSPFRLSASPPFFPFSSFSPSDKQTQGRPRVPTRAGHPLRASLQLETATQAPFTLAQLTQ